MNYDSLLFHNVADLRPVEDGDGLRLQRVPEKVRIELNEGGQERMLHPAGCEIRFVPNGPVSVTLSTTVRESDLRIFWGPFQESESVTVGSEPTTIEVEPPERLTALRDGGLADAPFSPSVCRLVLPGEHRGGHVFYHGVAGTVRPPRADELPDGRYLAYGTSITEGERPSAEQLTYVNQAARQLGFDAINLGSCGTAYCDAVMAEYIASRDDWNVATLALSVNMVWNFTVEEFSRRAAYMVETIASENPDALVACITLYPYTDDLLDSDQEDIDPDRAVAFRDALRDIVMDSPHDNVHLLEGPEILADPTGLTSDLVHPGDHGMIEMGRNIADQLEDLL